MCAPRPAPRLIRFFLHNEDAGTLIEYSLVGALVAVFTIAALQASGGSISGLFYGPVNDALAR